MSALEIVNLVVMVLLGGLLTFLATLLIKQDAWPEGLKLGISVVMAAVFALATAWKAGDIFNFATAWGEGMSAEAVLAYFVTYWTVASVWYKLVFKDTDWVNALGSWPRGT